MATRAFMDAPSPHILRPTCLSAVASAKAEAYNVGMRRTSSAPIIAAFAAAFCVSLAGQTKPAYRAPRTAWGAPDLHGDYTNKDEANTPLERPAQLAGKDVNSFSEAELAKLARDRSAA